MKIDVGSIAEKSFNQSNVTILRGINLGDLPYFPGVNSQEMSGTEVPLGWVATFELRYRDGSRFLPGWVAISAIRYKDRYRFSNSGIIRGIWSCSNHDHPSLLLFVTPFMPRHSNVKSHQLFKDKFTYSWSLVGILMGLTFALKQGVKVIRILELQQKSTIAVLGKHLEFREIHYCFYLREI